MKKTKLLAAFAIPSLSAMVLPLTLVTSCKTQDNIVINGNASYDKSTTKVTQKKASTVTLLADKGYIILGVESVSVEGKKLTTASYSYNPDTRQVSIKDYAMIGINVTIDVKTEAVVTKTAKLNWKDDSSISKYYYHFGIDKRQATVDTSNNVITFNISADPYWKPAAIVKGQWIVKNGLTTVKKQDANLRAATQYITIDDWSKINDGDELTIVFERNADEKWAKVEYDSTFLASSIDTTSCVVSVASHFNYLQLNVCANSDVDGTVSVVDTTTGKTVGTTDEITVDTYNKKHSIKLDWSNITDLGTLKVSFKENAPTDEKLKIVCDWHELDDVANKKDGLPIVVMTATGKVVSDATITVEPATVATVKSGRVYPLTGGSATITASKDGCTSATWEIEVATFGQVAFEDVTEEEKEEEPKPEEKNGEEAKTNESAESTESELLVHSIQNDKGTNCAQGDVVIPSRHWVVDYINNTAGWKTIVGIYMEGKEGGFQNYDKEENITSVVIPNTITDIPGNAFYMCDGMKKVTFAENSKIETIGQRAFYNCVELKEISIPDTVFAILPNAFVQSGLTTVKFGDNSKLIYIGDQAFGWTKISSFVIPYNVTTIRPYAFQAADAMTSVEFKNTNHWFNTSVPATSVVIGTDEEGKKTNAVNLKNFDEKASAFNWCYTGLYNIVLEQDFSTALKKLTQQFFESEEEYSTDQVKSVVVNGTPLTDFEIVYEGTGSRKTCAVSIPRGSGKLDVVFAAYALFEQLPKNIVPWAEGGSFLINQDGSIEYTYKETLETEGLYTRIVVNKWGYVTEWESIGDQEKAIISFKIEFDGDPE